jgi:hypothetical protein
MFGLVAVTASGVLGLQQLEQHITSLVSVGNVKSDATSRMRLAIVSRVDAVRNIALTTDINAMQADQKRIDEMVQALRRHRQLLLAPAAVRSREGGAGPGRRGRVAAAPLLKQAQALARTMQPEMAAEACCRASWRRCSGNGWRRWTNSCRSAEAERSAVLTTVQTARRTPCWAC